MNKIDQINKYLIELFNKHNGRLERMEENGVPDSENYYSTLGRVEMLEDIISHINQINAQDK